MNCQQLLSFASGFWCRKCFNKHLFCFWNFFPSIALWWRIFENNYKKESVFQFSLSLTFPPPKRLKLVQFAKGYFWMNGQLKSCWTATWLVIIFWIYSFLLRWLVFTCVIFLNRINFRFTNTNVMFPFTILLQNLYCRISFWAKISVKVSLLIYNFYYNSNCSNIIAQ